MQPRELWFSDILMYIHVRCIYHVPQPTGRTARLPEVTCIVSPLGCFSLYEKVQSAYVHVHVHCISLYLS